jgi:hypothetical protein
MPNQQRIGLTCPVSFCSLQRDHLTPYREAFVSGFKSLRKHKEAVLLFQVMVKQISGAYLSYVRIGQPLTGFKTLREGQTALAVWHFFFLWKA